MTPAITLLTLGVDDLQRAVAFYRDGLGFPTQGIVGADIENGAVAFFKLHSGLKLALWPRRSMAADAGLGTAGPRDMPGTSRTRTDTSGRSRSTRALPIWAEQKFTSYAFACGRLARRCAFLNPNTESRRCPLPFPQP